MTKYWNLSVAAILATLFATTPAFAQREAEPRTGAPLVVPMTPGAAGAGAQGGGAQGGGVTMGGTVPADRQAVPGGPIAAGLSLNVNLEPGGGVLLQLPRPAATVIVADPRVARVTPASATSLFLVGVSPGRTTMIVTDEAGLPAINYDISVRRMGGAEVGAAGGGGGPAVTQAAAPKDARQLEEMIHKLVPGSAGVKVELLEGTLLLRGMVGTPDQAQQLDVIARTISGGRGTTIINRVEVLSSMQVNVRVRVAEMSRTVQRDLGLNWRILGGSGSIVGGLVSPNQDAALGGAPITYNAANFALGFRRVTGNMDINGLLEALATNGLVSILAEPNLTTMSGEPASFLAGGEYPYQVISGTGGGQSVGYEFKQFGVSLAVVPTVLSPTRINMRIRPEVSELDFTIQRVIGGPPGLATRRAETTVELGSGQTFAIGGLLSNKISDNLTTMPWLGEVPVLGALFKSTAFQRKETELVILVTPYLVRPMNAMAQARTPNDGYKPATDLDRLLYSRQVHQSGAAQAGGTLDAGFILK